MLFGGQPTPWSDEQIDGLRCRAVAQMLIEEIGADGPESAEDAAKHAVTVIQHLRQRIAALEAEKAEREAQEPVAWAWNDALGCMHAHCGSRRPVWVDGECSDAKRAETSLRPLYAAPPVPRIDPDWLQSLIRQEIGGCSLELAEKIAEAINGRAK